MVKKNVTIDQLARMVEKGFEGQAEIFSKRFDRIESDLTIIKGQLVDTVHRFELDKLESRVEYLENVLNVAAKKR